VEELEDEAHPPAAKRGQLALGAAAVVGVGVARYYALVTLATLVALWNYARRGVPATWELAEGPR